MKSKRKIILLFLALLLAAGSTWVFWPRHYSFSDYQAQAESAVQKKDFTKAIQYYLKALDHFPQNEKSSQILLTIGDIYNFSLNNSAQAQKAYQLVFQQYPHSEAAHQAWIHQAEMFEKLEQFDQALLAYQSLLQYFPDHAQQEEVHFREAMMLLKLKKFDEARAAWMEMLEAKPESGLADQILYQIGSSFFVQGLAKEAIQVLETALQKYPESTLSMELQFTLAHAYEDVGRFQDAEKLFLELLPNYPNPTLIEKKLLNLRQKKEAPGPPSSSLKK